MNKKGFMFVETIMVMTILTTSLITIYITFSRVLINEKRRAMFDDTGYLYRTYLLQDYLVSLNLNDYLKKYLVDTGKKIIVFNAEESSLYNLYENGSRNDREAGKQAFSNKVISNGTDYLQISKIYITYYNVNDLKQCLTKSNKNSCDDPSMEALNNMSTNAILYIKTLSGTSNGYRLIVEYQESYIDHNKKSKLKNGSCPNGYVKEGTTCYRKVTKNYYNTTRLYAEE